MNDLPDSAFLHIAPGGSLDVEGKTIPRTLRQFPYRGEDGAVDVALLEAAVAAIPASNLSAEQKTTLATRARILLERPDSADATEWKTGAALSVRGLAYHLLDLSDSLADEQKAMRLLGEDTNDGARIRPEMRQRLSQVAQTLSAHVTWAETIERGEDGKARLALLRSRLALTEI